MYKIERLNHNTIWLNPNEITYPDFNDAKEVAKQNSLEETFQGYGVFPANQKGGVPTIIFMDGHAYIPHTRVPENEAPVIHGFIDDIDDWIERLRKLLNIPFAHSNGEDKTTADLMEEIEAAVKKQSHTGEENQMPASPSNGDTQSSLVSYQDYHANYNNDSYRAVQVAVITDLYGEVFANDEIIREQLLGKEDTNAIMNLLTDVAIEISNPSPALPNKRQVLIRLIAHHRLADRTVRLISQHLENFEKDGSTFSTDFENTALSLIQINGSRDAIQNAISLSAAIHGNRGRAAHHLLRSAKAFSFAAELLLKHESSQGYLMEQLEAGKDSLASALTETIKLKQ